jgi:outer membrane protein assembly factor BamD
MKSSVLVLACVLLVTAAGCSARKVPAGEDYYQQGEALYSQRQYQGAIENYQHLIDQFPFSPYAEQAELKIGLAYYKTGDYAQAVASLSDFQRMHPTSKNLALATYYLAMTHYKQVGLPDRDQSNTIAAMQQFEMIEQRFPESEFAELAHQRIVVCRELLARNELYIGNYYMKQANFRATESRMAELMENYPDTPVAPEGLYELGTALQKEGKKYSAAQAFTALVMHYPQSTFAAKAKVQLAILKQPVDTEEDPLRMVLTESGFNPTKSAAFDKTGANAELAEAGSAATGGYGPDGLPNLAQAAGQSSSAAPGKTGPATLRSIRLSSSDPPLSVIFDLSGPVAYDKEFKGGPGGATLQLHLKDTTPADHLEQHIVFDRSIFRDVDVATDATGTTVTVNTAPVSRFAIVPLGEPARLLITFTPPDKTIDQAANSDP